LSIFAIIALPLSFKSLEQGKYALQLGWASQKIDNEVLTKPGMYMVGLGNMLVEYPSTFQTMYFVADSRGITDEEDEDETSKAIRRGPLRARSLDGLEMIVSLSFQWQLESRSLKPLYDVLGGGTLVESLYRDEFVRFARAAIVESCTKFTADSFFKNRTIITEDMQDHVKTAFDKPKKNLFVVIKGLQLREVDLPNAFDEEIIKTQEQMQDVEVALAEREEQRITMLKELMVSEERVKQVKQEAEGAAEKTLLENEAVVKQMLIFQQKQATANSQILSKFVNDSDPYARLFELMEIRALNAHDGKKLLINL
jgi:hypothetical protein